MTAERAGRSDLDGIVGLERAAFGAGAWSADSWRAELDADDRDVLVARGPDGGLAGVVTVQTVGATADLLRLVVAPAARRHGLGTALVDAAVRAARARGARSMLLEVETGNDAAVALYGRYGFEQLGSRPDYYGPGRHALILKLYALDGPVPVQVDWLPDAEWTGHPGGEHD